MERHQIYDAKSIFFRMKNKNANHIENLKLNLLSEELILNAEINKMQERVNELQQRVGNESSDINDLLKELEYYLPLGNNNKKLNQIIFNSKIFLSIIDCLNYTKAKFLPKLLSFIEKMLRGNRHISKYLSNKPEFIRKILTLMRKEALFEICIKITEELFMDSGKLIPIEQFYNELEANYLLVETTNLNILCRVLAIMIFDHKKIEFKQIFKYKENMKVRPHAKVTTENQSVCFHLPKFLHNLIMSLK